MNGAMTRRACRFALLLLCIPGATVLSRAAGADAADNESDFRQFCDFVRTEYAYFDLKATDWRTTCDSLMPTAKGARTRDEFVATLETALAQLYDSHSHLGTNTSASLRLVPTGSQLRLAWLAGKAVVTDVRRDSAAARAGIHAGDVLIALDGIPAEKVVSALEPRHLLRGDPLARDWALNVAVAGRHLQKTRTLALETSSGQRMVEFNADDTGEQPGLLESRRIGNVGYVRIHNSLGDDALVSAFDKVVGEFAGVAGLVLDLRDTPSGGTSSVARGIMGHLVATPSPYQRHEYVAEGRETGVPRVWVEYVTPRSPRLDAPMVILVGAWTGSMGEGIAIGLNSARGAPVIGRRMAQLLGALGETRLSHSGIVVRVPNEKLSHVNGTPRESFAPRDAGGPLREDALLETALRQLATGTN
jgi:C-terminal processing protease CtpA/Prc